MTNHFYAGAFMGIVLGISITVLSYLSYDTMLRENTDIANYNALHEKTNNSINGIYFLRSSFCVSMDRDNIEGLKNTIDHEFLHELIGNNHTCGNETCWEHFCGGKG